MDLIAWLHFDHNPSLSAQNLHVVLEVDRPPWEYRLTVMKKKAKWFGQKKEGT